MQSLRNDATEPEAQSSDQHAERFSTRVAVGTLVGVMTCLLFAALLMLFSLPPNLSGNSFGGEGSGHGTGTGDKAGDGTSSDEDSHGEDDRNVAGDPDPSTSASAGRDGLETGSKATTGESGSAGDKAVQKDVPEAGGTGTLAAKTTLESPSFVIPPIEKLQLDPSDHEGIRKPAVARAPGMFSGRDAEVRRKLAETEGGNAASEAAVERGLKWLADHQDQDGHWSLHEFHTAGECNGRCSMPGTVSDAAGTGFGLLPFLGAGYTHKKGKYKKTVQAGLDWLIADQTREGTYRHCQGGTLYAHGIASIALCEAYAMTKDPKLKQPAQRAIDYIEKAQNKLGGWRYRPGEPGDTSVTGWQVIALRSAQQGGLKVSKDVMTRVTQYLDSVQTDKQGSGYHYMPRNRITDAMIAEGLLCRIYTSSNLKRSGLKAGAENLLTRPPRLGGELYYWYYATQVMHHYGGDPWKEWNPAMRDLLIELQATDGQEGHDGHESGSWAPSGGHDGSGGRLYATSLALLTLEVYYRHKRAF